MMKKQVISAAALLSLVVWSGQASADGFVNGNFENGTLNGWTTGSGYTNIPTDSLDPSAFFSGGAAYDLSAQAITVTTLGGIDAITGASTVYSGNYAVRVNDALNNYSVSVIKQSVSNYQDNQIAFAWNAVLQESHGLNDSDAFNLTLRDDTTGVTLVNRSYSSASAPSIFTPFTDIYTGTWYSSGWKTETLDVSALKGHSFTLSLLATDCPYGGHAGYVYLDGFGGSAPTQGPVTGNVPEPESYALMLAGALVVGGSLRRRSRA
jgi:hypothetical protein